MRRYQAEPSHGFTFIETLMAMALLVAIAVPVINWLQNQYLFSIDDREQATVNIRLHDIVEEIRAGHKSDIFLLKPGGLYSENVSTGHPLTTSYNISAVVGESPMLWEVYSSVPFFPGGAYTLEIRALTASSSATAININHATLSRYSVTIKWKDRRGRDRSNELTVAVAY
ncbi:MAG: hypothetical protein FWF06_05440 [Symbiobacteriaceae bacterium]|nr:hypothetical protein [Symbiobacteriaceae bacterium]